MKKHLLGLSILTLICVNSVCDALEVSMTVLKCQRQLKVARLTNPSDFKIARDSYSGLQINWGQENGSLSKRSTVGIFAVDNLLNSNQEIFYQRQIDVEPESGPRQRRSGTSKSWYIDSKATVTSKERLEEYWSEPQNGQRMNLYSKTIDNQFIHAGLIDTFRQSPDKVQVNIETFEKVHRVDFLASSRISCEHVPVSDPSVSEMTANFRPVLIDVKRVLDQVARLDSDLQGDGKMLQLAISDLKESWIEHAKAKMIGFQQKRQRKIDRESRKSQNRQNGVDHYEQRYLNEILRDLQCERTGCLRYRDDFELGSY